MKVLILSCNTGEGHNSAARSIKEQFDALSVPCDIEDGLRFGFKGVSRMLSKGHVFLYKYLPKVFGAGYQMMEMNREKKSRSLLYRFNALAAKKMWRFVLDGGYDCVICTHMFPACAMTAAVYLYGPAVPFYLVLTDYTCYPGVCDIDADAFFVPHKDIAWEFEAEGIPERKLVISGLPIAEKFEQRTPKAEAARMLGLSRDTQKVLLMCGSMGCGPIEQLAQDLSGVLTDKQELVAICGHNKSLKERLEEKKLPHTTVVGYTTQMDLYMDSADVLITKAGGLSSTEAARKGLPILYMDAVPGCETRNLYFFCQKGYARAAFKPSLLPRALVQMLSDEKALAHTSERLKAEFPAHAAQKICKYTIQKDQNATDKGELTDGSSNSENS